MQLSDVFGNFRDTCQETYQLDPAYSGICQSIHRRATANNKYMKDYDENVESSYLQNLDANNLYGWEMSKKLPIGEFKWDDPKN